MGRRKRPRKKKGEEDGGKEGAGWFTVRALRQEQNQSLRVIKAVRGGTHTVLGTFSATQKWKSGELVVCVS